MDHTLTIAGSVFAIRAVERSGGWLAEARRAASGVRAGPAVTAASADAAVARLVRWLEWQQEHETALAALQAAERAYHRTVAGSAFASGLADATEAQHAALREVDEARTRLDGIRQALPEV